MSRAEIKYKAAVPVEEIVLHLNADEAVRVRNVLAKNVSRGDDDKHYTLPTYCALNAACVEAGLGDYRA